MTTRLAAAGSGGILLAVLASLAVGGTAWFPAPESPAREFCDRHEPDVAVSAADLAQLVAREGSVTFRSSDGRWIGTDGDVDLTFLPNGRAHLFWYSYSVLRNHGRYSVDGRGDVTVELPKRPWLPKGWPVMSLRRDSTSMLLWPKVSCDDVVMLWHWPFRPLPLAEEGQVRGRIER